MEHIWLDVSGNDRCHLHAILEAIQVSEYNITFLYRFTSPAGGVALHLKEGDKSLTLTKAGAFEAWREDDMLLALKSGTKPTHEVNRAYLHYIIDCWLDEKPVELQPSEF